MIKVRTKLMHSCHREYGPWFNGDKSSGRNRSVNMLVETEIRRPSPQKTSSSPYHATLPVLLFIDQSLQETLNYYYGMITCKWGDGMASPWSPSSSGNRRSSLPLLADKTRNYSSAIFTLLLPFYFNETNVNLLKGWNWETWKTRYKT